jgi:hypothetical protein
MTEFSFLTNKNDRERDALKIAFPEYTSGTGTEN